MDNASRLQYLEAMGVDVWVPRHLPPVVTPKADSYVANDLARDHSSVIQSNDEKMAQSQPDKTAQPVEEKLSASLINRQPMEQRVDSEQAWARLKTEVASCHACKLCETRTQTVFGVGNHHADWMLIGEAPGQNEDLQGEPFVGRAGQLLNEMLRAIGLKREQVFIANILKCRPPNNRDPQAEEIAACHNFLLRQIELVNPKIILAVGRIAAQNLLKTQQSLAKLRGVEHRLENYPLVVVHHPAYLLRSLTEKAKAWDDLQFALSLYQSLEK